MDKLLTTTLHSDCSSFDVKTYVHNGRKKTYMYISGCPKELGCTIVLRGGDEQILGKVKQITEFMVYVVYNLRLETYLMRDEFAKLPTASGNDANQVVCTEEKKNNSQAGIHQNNAGATESESVTEKTLRVLKTRWLRGLLKFLMMFQCQHTTMTWFMIIRQKSCPLHLSSNSNLRTYS